MVRDFPEQECQVPTSVPRFCHSREGAQTVSGGFWRDRSGDPGEEQGRKVGRQHEQEENLTMSREVTALL